tara:strand:- start:141 stop:323 length:183 start_codon:yes stop_codon:yes gene_type:complete
MEDRMTIHDYFNHLTNIGLNIEMTEEFSDAIIDTLEIIRNHPIGDFENKIEEETYDEEEE